MVGRLLLSAILTGIIGWEREVYHKPAGFRTHILVGLGASLVTLLSISGVQGYYDHARLLAAVVMGIGFLGAGVIIKTTEHVYGLTTAASIWFAASLAISISLGVYDIGISAFIIALIALQMKYWVGEEIGYTERGNTGKIGKKGNRRVSRKRA